MKKEEEECVRWDLSLRLGCTQPIRHCGKFKGLRGQWDGLEDHFHFLHCTEIGSPS